MSQVLSIREIRNRLKIIEGQVSKIVEDKYYFEQFKAYVQKSKTLDKNNDFLSFIAFNSRDLMAINACKQTDEDSRAESLINLLKDIKKNKKLFTIDWFIKKYPKWLRSNGINDFKKFSTKNNKIVSCKKIDEDIKNMKKAIVGVRKNSLKSLKKFRDKRGAHHNKGKVKITATVKDLNDAIDLLERLVLKYRLLIDQSGMDTLLPADSKPELGNIFR